MMLDECWFSARAHISCRVGSIPIPVTKIERKIEYGNNTMLWRMWLES